MIIADTGFWLAIANRRDRHHTLAVGMSKKVREQLVTTSPVMTETCHLLQSQLGVEAEIAFMRSARDGAFVICSMLDVHLGRIAELMDIYRDLPVRCLAGDTR